MVLLRFAPSPTGALHLGGLRTALYNYLYARKLGGKWILRIEDTDATRHVPGAVDNIREALHWAGLEYDYGPGKGGPHAPYFQSERLDLYRSYAKKLIESGHAYRCFCTPDRLSYTRERLARSGSNETYDKACLNLTEEEATRKVRAGEKHVVRLNDGILPSRSTPHDIVFGELKDSHASIPTDPILLKSDLFPTYHLASVADDHEMDITHVIRGEEWLPSLPLHLDLYACLSIPPPSFAHLSLLLNPDGSKMSKRKGDVQVMDYVRRGFQPEAILNWLALAGWGVQHDSASSSSSSQAPPKDLQAPDSTAVMDLSEIMRKFDLSALTRRRTILDPTKLEYISTHHLMRRASTSSGLDDMAKKAHNLVKEAFPTSQFTTEAYIKKVIGVLQGRLMNLQDITSVPYFFVDPDLSTSDALSMIRTVTVDEYLDVTKASASALESSEFKWKPDNIRNILYEQVAKLGLKPKPVMSVIRHAVTGISAGPTLPEIIHVLGRERSVQRLKSAADKPQGKI